MATVLEDREGLEVNFITKLISIFLSFSWERWPSGNSNSKRKHILQNQCWALKSYCLKHDEVISIYKMCYLKNIIPLLLCNHFFWIGSFFSSWNASMCWFRQIFLAKDELQMQHVNGFFPAWTDSKCLLRFSFWEKLVSQMPHQNCLVILHFREEV